MKLPSEADHVTALAAETARREREAKETAAVYAEVKKNQLKKLEEARKDEAAKIAVLDRLIRETAEVAATAEAEARRRIAEANISDEAFKSGKVSAEEFLAGHLEPAEIDRAATAAAREKVRPVFRAARAAALEAENAKKLVAEAEFEIAFADSAPLQARLEAQKARLKEVEGVAGMGLSALAVAANRRHDVLRRLAIAAGESFQYGGLQLYDLDLAALERLRFDPIVRELELDRFEELIDQVRRKGSDGRVAVLTFSHDGALTARMG